MLIVIGAKRICANGNMNPVKSRIPPKTSVALIIGNIYPVAANPPIKAPAAPAGGGGMGKKFKNPLSPKTKNINPNKYLAALAALFIVVPLVYSERLPIADCKTLNALDQVGRNPEMLAKHNCL